MVDRERHNSGPTPIWLLRGAWLLALMTCPGGWCVPGLLLGAFLTPDDRTSMLVLTIAGAIYPILMFGGVYATERTAWMLQERRLAGSGKRYRGPLVLAALGIAVFTSLNIFVAHKESQRLPADAAQHKKP